IAVILDDLFGIKPGHYQEHQLIL
ncbi:uncharacterized protein METZ01_LOCUS248249, partial [marine metagenome]